MTITGPDDRDGRGLRPAHPRRGHRTGPLVPPAGAFSFIFDPVAINAKAPTYDIVNITNGKTELGKVVHLTFFAKERAADGTAGHSFARLVFRGNKLFFARQ